MMRSRAWCWAAVAVLLPNVLSACNGTTEPDDDDMTIDGWESLAPLPVAVRSAAVATDGERVYVVGGFASFGRTGVLQTLDLEAGTWSYGPSLPVATDWGVATWVEGALHFMGGVTDEASASTQHYVYVPGSDEWESGTALPTTLAGMAGLTDGARIYIFAGNSGGSPAHTSATHIYHVASESWSEGPSVPEPRINWSGTYLNGRFYLIGGGTAGLTTSDALLEYDPVSAEWQELRPVPIPREAHGVASSLGMVCAIGGRLARAGNFNAPYDNVACYDRENDRWEPAPTLPRPRQEVAAVSVGDVMIAVGGADGSGFPVPDVTALQVP